MQENKNNLNQFTCGWQMSSKSKYNTITELRDNIFQIKSRPPCCHVYVIKGDNKNVMIDPGFVENFENIKLNLSKINIKKKDIHLIVLTHEHLDHTGAAKYFCDNSLVAAHTQASNKIALNDEFAIMNKAFHMAPENIHVDICLESGVIIDLGNYKLRIIHTPGHCSGSICVYEEKSGIVFTGDTVLAGGIITGIFPSGSISDYINSLNKLISLRISALFPGHGKISQRPYDDLNKAIENATKILNNSRLLFNTLNTNKSFETIFKSARKFVLPK